MAHRQSTPPRSSPPLWTPPPPGTTFARGAKPTPRHKLLAAVPHVAVEAPPAQFAIVPAKLSMWDNDRDGVCVTSEEAFAKACHSPEIFIPDAEVVRWAKLHGVLNGAMLDEVLDWMATTGFKDGNQLYNDGPKQGVNYGDLNTLKSAIATSGVVKIAIDADALPSGAGNQQGWHAFGGGRFPSTDHCVGIPGYGPAGWLYGQLGVPVPSGVDPNKPDCLLLFTWSTIGVVDFPWFMGTCTEAWARSPTTVGVPPIPEPTPPPVPPPPPGPGPAPGPSTLQQWIDAMFIMLAGKYPMSAWLILYVKGLVDQYLFRKPHLALRSMRGVKGSQLQAVIDALFDTLIAAESGHPLAAYAITVVRAMVDAYIQSHGF